MKITPRSTSSSRSLARWRRTPVWKANILFLSLNRASIALMMESISTSETSVNFYEITRRNIRDDSHLQCQLLLTNSIYSKTGSLEWRQTKREMTRASRSELNENRGNRAMRLVNTTFERASVSWLAAVNWSDPSLYPRCKEYKANTVQRATPQSLITVRELEKYHQARFKPSPPAFC
jgi:hypothetical protein